MLTIMVRTVSLFLMAAAGLVSAACGGADLSKAVQVNVVSSGFYDLGVIDGRTKIVPGASVRVKNVGTAPIDGFQISASFWIVGDDGMKDEIQLMGLVAKDLAPGAESEPIVLKASHGYTLDVPRSQAFQNTLYRDFTIRVLGKTAGRIYRLGDFKIDQRIFPKDGATPTT